MKFPIRVTREYRASTSTLSAPAGWLTDALAGPGMQTGAGERVNQTKALGITGVFSAVYKISEGVGQLPFKVFRKIDDDVEEAQTHRMWRVLHDKPNPETIAHTFWSTVAAQLLLGGNAYILKERSDPFSEVDTLWLLEPGKVEVRIASDGSKRFIYTEGFTRTTYTADEVLHIVGFSIDGLVGVSRIHYCRQTLGAALARDHYEGAFYKRGGKPAGWIGHPGRLGDAGVKRLSEAMKAFHGGSDNMHKFAVLEEGAAMNAFGMSLADMQFVENAQLSLTEIAVMFDLPPGELGGMHGGSLEYSTEEMNQIRLARAIVPYTSRIAKAVSNDPELLPQNVMYAEFVLEAMMRPDIKTQVEYWAGLKALGVVDADYIARRLNLPPPPTDVEQADPGKPKPLSPTSYFPPVVGPGSAAVAPVVPPAAKNGA